LIFYAPGGRGSAPDPRPEQAQGRTAEHRNVDLYAGRRRRGSVRALLPFLLFLLLWSFPAAKASAHAVFIYARPEGERICTESWFSKKNKVKGGEVRMEDARGELLASGVTDEAGIACFPVPAGGGDLRFIVLAGQGHRAEFILPALREAVPSTLSPEPAVSEASAPVSRESAVPEASAQASPAAAVSEAPAPAGTLRLSGTAGATPAYAVAPPPAGGDGPSLRDIIGGAGWLVGLAGLSAFAVARRKKH
jgi:nickel transport protein